MHHSRAALPALLLVCLATGAAAHESWLSASDWEPRPGEEVVVRDTLGAGFAGEARPFSEPRIRRLVLRQSSVQDLTTTGLDLGAIGARFVPEDDDGALIAYETQPATVMMDAAEFDAHVEEMGLDDVRDLRLASDFDPAPARERSRTCAKAWLGGNDWRRVKRPIGMPLEIVPRHEPTRASSLRFRLLFKGRPLAGALVRTWMQPLDEMGGPVDPAHRLELPAYQQVRTNEIGIARIDTGRHGEYLVTASHAVPCRDPHAADWDTWTASLTFARGAGRHLQFQPTRPLRGTGLGRNPDLGDPGFGWSTSLRDSPGWRR